MASIQLTIDDDKLQRLFGTSDGLKHLLEACVNETLESEMTDFLGAERGERTGERRGYRNGYYQRRITTRVGTLTLDVPRDREGVFRTELFERFQRSEQALVLTLMDMVVNGVSTRKVKKVTSTLCGHEFSKSTVSELAKGLDEKVTAWAERPLDEQAYPFVIADAMYVKVRRLGRVCSTAVLIAVGVSEDGHREVLGIDVSLKESEIAWGEFFRQLGRRGLSGIDTVVSDKHEGLVKALRESFPGASWQRCQAHFIRNVMDATPRKARDQVKNLLDDVLQAGDTAEARENLERFIDELQDVAPTAVSTLEEAFDDVTSVIGLPRKYRRRLRTTNMLERTIEEIRRRERVIRIFPNEASIFRMIGALMAEQHEAWATGRLYLNMDEYVDYKNALTDNTEPAALAA